VVDGVRCQQVVDPPDRPLPELYFDCRWAIGILDVDIRFVNLWIYGREELYRSDLVTRFLVISW
jgi:hypothetical protein